MGIQSQRRSTTSRKLRERSTKSHGGRRSGILATYKIARYMAMDKNKDPNSALASSAPAPAPAVMPKQNPYAQSLGFATAGMQNPLKPPPRELPPKDLPRKKTKRKATVARKPQKEPGTNLLLPTGDGSMACRRCIKGPDWKHGHHPSCKKSEYYGMTKEQIESSIALKKQKKERAALSDQEKYKETRLAARAFVARHFPQRVQPANRPASAAAPVASPATSAKISAKTSAESQAEKSNTTQSAEIFNKVVRRPAASVVTVSNGSTGSSCDTATPGATSGPNKPIILADLVSETIATCVKGETELRSPGVPVAALLKKVISMAPAAFKSDLNDIIDTEKNRNRLAAFRTAFGYSLTAKIPFVPVRDEDGHINSASITLAGHSITIMRWELLEPGIELKCLSVAMGISFTGAATLGRTKRSLLCLKSIARSTGRPLELTSVTTASRRWLQMTHVS